MGGLPLREDRTIASLAPSGPDEFEITVHKAVNQKVGIDMRPRETPPAMKVHRILPGVIHDWNEQHPEQAIMENDIILAVNHDHTSVDDMCRTMVTCETLTLLVHREGLKSSRETR